jgi:hypothetical protein
MGKYLLIYFHQARINEHNERIVNLGSAAGMAESSLVASAPQNSMLTTFSSLSGLQCSSALVCCKLIQPFK